VETQFGYHIIKLTEKKGPSEVPFNEVKGRIEEFLLKQKMQKAVQEYIEAAKGKAKVELFNK